MTYSTLSVRRRDKAITLRRLLGLAHGYRAGEWKRLGARYGMNHEYLRRVVQRATAPAVMIVAPWRLGSRTTGALDRSSYETLAVTASRGRSEQVKASLRCIWAVREQIDHEQWPREWRDP